MTAQNRRHGADEADNASSLSCSCSTFIRGRARFQRKIAGGATAEVIPKKITAEGSMHKTFAGLPNRPAGLDVRTAVAYDETMDELFAGRVRMVELLERLDAPEGARASRVSGVMLLRASRSYPPVPLIHEPCVVIVARGTKRFHLPNRVITYDAANYLSVTVPVLADCETRVAHDGSFLGIIVRIDLDVLGELLLTLGPRISVARPDSDFLTCMTATIDIGVSRAAIRLMETLHSSIDSRVLGPQLVRELLYRVLCGTSGDAFRVLLLGSESKAHIHRILQRLHLEYAEPVNVSELARGAAMSTSALRLHVRQITGTSPVQYVKTIRLHKARMMMVQESVAGATAAERVGYESASQFSRELNAVSDRRPCAKRSDCESLSGCPTMAR